MSRLGDQFEQSEFPVRLRRVRDRLDGLSKKDRKKADEIEPTETLDRLDAALGWVEAVVVGTDPRLTATTMLDGADGQLSQIETSLNALIDNDDDSQLSLIDTGCDGLLAQVAAWPSAATFTDDSIRRLATDFGRTAEERLARIDSDAAQITERLARLAEEAEEHREQLGTRQDELEAAITGQEAQVQAVVTSSEQDYATFKSEVEERATTEQQELRDRIAEVETEVREATQTLREQVEQRASETATGPKERSDELIAYLEERKTEAEGLLDAVATSSTAGSFKKEAEDQKAEADNWRRNALLISSKSLRP